VISLYVRAYAYNKKAMTYYQQKKENFYFHYIIFCVSQLCMMPSLSNNEKIKLNDGGIKACLYSLFVRECISNVCAVPEKIDGRKENE
jgi:hypothetical protein